MDRLQTVRRIKILFVDDDEVVVMVCRVLARWADSMLRSRVRCVVGFAVHDG
jgi:hypothetical protein